METSGLEVIKSRCEVLFIRMRERGKGAASAVVVGEKEAEWRRNGWKRTISPEPMPKGIRDA